MNKRTVDFHFVLDLVFITNKTNNMRILIKSEFYCLKHLTEPNKGIFMAQIFILSLDLLLISIHSTSIIKLVINVFIYLLGKKKSTSHVLLG